MYNEIFRSNYEDVNLSILIYDKGYSLIYNPKAVTEHLRQDSVLSVLNTYWNWQYFRNIKLAAATNFYRKIAAQLGSCFYFPEGAWDLLMQDWQNRDWGLMFIDSVALFYYPWLNIKYLAYRFILWIKKA